MGPLALFRQARELEPPSLDEGFVQIDVVPFVREPDQELRAGAVTPLDAPDSASAGLPTLSLGWRPGAGTFTLDGDVATCPHPAGPPICWCRPPLPGAVVAWAHRRRVDVARITVLGSSPAFRSLARAFVGGSA
jgi:hypothetical protein